jgi:hypothetical protein
MTEYIRMLYDRRMVSGCRELAFLFKVLAVAVLAWLPGRATLSDVTLLQKYQGTYAGTMAGSASAALASPAGSPSGAERQDGLTDLQRAMENVKRAERERTTQAVTATVSIRGDGSQWLVTLTFTGRPLGDAPRRLAANVEADKAGSMRVRAADGNAASHVGGGGSDAGLTLYEAPAGRSARDQMLQVYLRPSDDGLRLVAWLTDSGGHRVTGWSGLLKRQ